MRQNPDQSAASLLPEAAAANKNVFYDKSGKALSVGQIYNRFAAKFDGMPASTMTASAGAIGLPNVKGGWASEAGMNSPFTAKAASGVANGEPNSLFTVMMLSQLNDPKAHTSKDDKDDGKEGSQGRHRRPVQLDAAVHAKTRGQTWALRDGNSFAVAS